MTASEVVSNAFTATRILVTGATSGLGRTFLEHYATADRAVTGIDARPWPQTAELPTSARFAQVDVTDESFVKAFLSTCDVFDLVIHSAGIRGLVPAVEDAHPDDVAAAETLVVMDPATMLRTYEVNAVGTFTLLKHLVRLLRRSSARPPRVVIMSSRMGSVSYNTTGGAYAYRASKAALNAIVKSFSIDVPDVCFACVHPGRVETGLVRTLEEGAISAEESVETMLDVIERLGVEGDLKSGCFVDRWGNDIGW